MEAHNHGTLPSLAAPELALHDVVDLAPLGTAAARAVVTPTSDNAHLAVGAVVKGQGRTDNLDCADYLAGDQPGDDCKRFATLRARLALAGWGLIRTDPTDGAPIYFATRWNMPRELADLAAVARFLDQVGGAV